MNRSKEFIFDSLIKELDQSAQATLKMAFNRCMLRDEQQHKWEMEQMKREIMEEITANLSASIDAEELVKAIKGVNKEIDGLERK